MVTKERPSGIWGLQGLISVDRTGLNSHMPSGAQRTNPHFGEVILWRRTVILVEERNQGRDGTGICCSAASMKIDDGLMVESVLTGVWRMLRVPAIHMV